MSNHKLSEEKKNNDTNVITRHNAIVKSCDQHLLKYSFSLVHTCLQFIE